MKTITVHNYLYSVGYKAIAINELELTSKPIGEGAFGEVYECIALNGKSTPQPLAVKVFFNFNPSKAPETYRTILQLQKRMQDYENKKTHKPLNQILSLETLPRITFHGELNGKTIYGYVTKFLAAPNWIGFHKLFDEENVEKRKKLKEVFYRKTYTEKMRFAKQLVEGFQALRAMSFIHADLNPHNLFINIKTNNLAIIDFDSGAITNEGSSEAETFGKLGDWLAPEIRNQLIKSGQGKVKVNLYTDSWAVAVGIHAMFFWAHPLFYLKSQGKRDMEDYFSQFVYPEIDVSNRNFRNEYNNAYKKYTSFLNSLPTEVSSAFKMSFNEGFYVPSKRLSYSQWLRILENTPNQVPKQKVAPQKVSRARTSPQNRNYFSQLNSINKKIRSSKFFTIQIDLRPVTTSVKIGFKQVWLKIFKPPEIKELKRKIQILESSERSLTKKVSSLSKAVETLENEKDKLDTSTSSLKKKNERLIDSQQNLLAERNKLQRNNQSQKREIGKLRRKIFYLQSQKWLGQNSKKVILLLLLVILLSWLLFLLNII